MRKQLAMASLSSCLFLLSCVRNPSSDTKIIYAMDTVITITLYDVSNSDTYLNNIKDIYNEVSKVSNDYKSGEDTISIYDLNMNREALVSDTLLDILKESVLLYEKTNHYFNPFIGSLSHKWKDALKSKEVLSQSEIDLELNKMKDTSLEINGNTVKINGLGNIDLGAIAKGYATKLAVDYLKENNISSYLINAGKSSIALGNKAGFSLKVALDHPLKTDKRIGIIEDKNMVISCSSLENQNTLVDGKVYHHLLNPYTGYPAEFYDAVYVMNDNPMLGDVYSTALFAMDLNDATLFASEKNINILLYKDDSTLYKSEGVELI